MSGNPLTWEKLLTSEPAQAYLGKGGELCLEELAAGSPHGEVCEGGERLMSWRTKTRTKLKTADRAKECLKHKAVFLYSATANAGADPPIRWGRPTPMEGYERTASIGPAGVVVTRWMYRKAHGTRETTAVEMEDQNQPATRESQAGLFGAAEGILVPMKLGNAGGGKGPCS